MDRTAATEAIAALPWRGPGADRPAALALPPDRMPLRFAGTNRKRWRYLGAYSDELLICAARLQVGLAGQTFWAIYDRSNDRVYERTRRMLPGMRGEVWSQTRDGHPVEWSPDEGSVMHLESEDPDDGAVEARFELGGGTWVESICPTGAGGYVWTRKRACLPVRGRVRIGDREFKVDALGVEDESAGYHPRHTVWSWSAGVGESADGRAVGWNLVEGINDPPRDSERAIWIDGEPSEPSPVAFDGLDAIDFGDGNRLTFTAESVRSRSENLWFVRYSYRQPFGTFTGTLPGGIELKSGLGVMESHDAVW